MGFDVRGRHVLVTGASRGIGLGIAAALAARDARLTLVARDEGRLRAAAAGAALGGVAVVAADFRRDEELAQVVPRAVAANGPVEALINNAGVYKIHLAAKAALADWDEMLAVDLRAPMHLVHAVLPAMLAAGRGAVINIASIAGKHGFPGNSGYCAAKFGLVGFGEALFTEVRDRGILVSTICPAMVRTDMTAGIHGANRDRMLDVGDVVKALLYVLDAGANAVPVSVDLWTQRDVFG